eukprot:PhM_4_TR1966/c0_g1_i1/m.96269
MPMSLSAEVGFCVCADRFSISSRAPGVILPPPPPMHVPPSTTAHGGALLRLTFEMGVAKACAGVFAGVACGISPFCLGGVGCGAALTVLRSSTLGCMSRRALMGSCFLRQCLLTKATKGFALPGIVPKVCRGVSCTASPKSADDSPTRSRSTDDAFWYLLNCARQSPAGRLVLFVTRALSVISSPEVRRFDDVVEMWSASSTKLEVGRGASSRSASGSDTRWSYSGPDSTSPLPGSSTLSSSVIATLCSASSSLPTVASTTADIPSPNWLRLDGAFVEGRVEAVSALASATDDTVVRVPRDVRAASSLIVSRVLDLCTLCASLSVFSSVGTVLTRSSSSSVWWLDSSGWSSSSGMSCGGTSSSKSPSVVASPNIFERNVFT